MLSNSRLFSLLIILLFSLFHLYVSENKFLIGGDSILPFDKNFNFHWKGFWNSSISNGSFLFTFYRPLEILYSFFYFFTDNHIYVSNLVICFFKFICGYFLLILLSEISKNKFLVFLFIFYYLHSPVFFNLDILPIFYYNLPILSCFIYFSLIKNQIKFISIFSYLVFFYLSLIELPQPKYFIFGNLLILYFFFYNYFTFKKNSFLFQKKIFFLIINVLFLNLVILFLLYTSFIQNYNASNISNVTSPNILPEYLRYDQYFNNLTHGLRFFHNNTVLDNNNINLFNNFIFQIFYYVPFLSLLFSLKHINSHKIFIYLLPPIIFFITLYLASNFPVFTIRDFILMNFKALSFLRTSSGINAYIFILIFYLFFLILDISNIKNLTKIIFVFIFVLFSTFHFTSKNYYKSKYDLIVPNEYFEARDFLNKNFSNSNNIFLIDAKGGYVALNWGYQGPRSLYNFLFNEINLTYNALDNNPRYLIVDKSSGNYFSSLSKNNYIFDNKYISILDLNPTNKLIFTSDESNNVQIFKKNNYLYDFTIKSSNRLAEADIFFNVNYNKYWFLIDKNKFFVNTKIQRSENFNNINFFRTKSNTRYLLIFIPFIFEYIIYLLTFFIILSFLLVKRKK